MKELLASQEQLHANTVSCIMTAMIPLLSISTVQIGTQQARQQQQQTTGEEEDEEVVAALPAASTQQVQPTTG